MNNMFFYYKIYISNLFLTTLLCTCMYDDDDVDGDNYDAKILID